MPKYSWKSNVFFEYKEKEIENERIFFTCKIEIDWGNIISYKIVIIVYEFEGIAKKIEIQKKDFNCNIFILEEIDIGIWNLLKYNSSKTFRWDKIKDYNDFKNMKEYMHTLGINENEKLIEENNNLTLKIVLFKELIQNSKTLILEAALNNNIVFFELFKKYGGDINYFKKFFQFGTSS